MGCYFLLQRIFSTQGLNSLSVVSPALADAFFTTEPPGNSTFFLQFSSVQFSSVAQSCLTLCDPMDCSTRGFPVIHQLLELAQTHVLQVGEAIQSSCSLFFPSPPALIFPRFRVFSNELALLIRWSKYWSFSISLSNEYI